MSLKCDRLTPCLIRRVHVKLANFPNKDHCPIRVVDPYLQKHLYDKLSATKASKLEQLLILVYLISAFRLTLSKGIQTAIDKQRKVKIRLF